MQDLLLPQRAPILARFFVRRITAIDVEWTPEALVAGRDLQRAAYGFSLSFAFAVATLAGEMFFLTEACSNSAHCFALIHLLLFIVMLPGMCAEGAALMIIFSNAAVMLLFVTSYGKNTCNTVVVADSTMYFSCALAGWFAARAKKKGGDLRELLKRDLALADLRTATPSDELCAICQNRVDSGASCITPCGHAFHYLCYRQAITTSNFCPVCRRRVVRRLELSNTDSFFFAICFSSSYAWRLWTLIFLVLFTSVLTILGAFLCGNWSP